MESSSFPQVLDSFLAASVEEGCRPVVVICVGSTTPYPSVDKDPSVNFHACLGRKLQTAVEYLKTQHRQHVLLVTGGNAMFIQHTICSGIQHTLNFAPSRYDPKDNPFFRGGNIIIAGETMEERRDLMLGAFKSTTYKEQAIPVTILAASGGGPGTYDELKRSVDHGYPIVAVHATGGAAGGRSFGASCPGIFISYPPFIEATPDRSCLDFSVDTPTEVLDRAAELTLYMLFGKDLLSPLFE